MWLLKTEPGDYSWDQLAKAGRARWDGVRNPAALRNLAAMKPGDRVLVYHTGDQKAVVGIAEVARAAYPDPRYPDGKLLVVDVEARTRLARPVSLGEIKALSEFRESPLLRQGRLSVVPITEAQWRAVEARGRG